MSYLCIKNVSKLLRYVLLFLNEISTNSRKSLFVLFIIQCPALLYLVFCLHMAIAWGQILPRPPLLLVKQHFNFTRIDATCMHIKYHPTHNHFSITKFLASSESKKHIFAIMQVAQHIPSEKMGGG